MLDDSQLQELVEGLEANNINRFSNTYLQLHLLHTLNCQILSYHQRLHWKQELPDQVWRGGEEVERGEISPCPVPDSFPCPR